MAGDENPFTGASTNAKASAPIAAMNSSWPPGSKLWPAGSEDSDTNRYVSTMATPPTSGLITKIERQPKVSVSNPPTVGPMARPTAAMPVQRPTARVLAVGSV